MAEYLKKFTQGEKIKASETNDNNDYLLDRISDNASSIQTYVEQQINTIQSNLSSIQKTLQNNIDKLKTELKAQINALENAKFTQKNLTISTGTTNLKSYLPNDSKHYLVWVWGYTSHVSGNATVATDIMSARKFLQLDGDYGRSSQDTALCVVPVGAGRTITISGSVDNLALCGYCKI